MQQQSVYERESILGIVSKIFCISVNTNEYLPFCKTAAVGIRHCLQFSVVVKRMPLEGSRREPRQTFSDSLINIAEKMAKKYEREGKLSLRLQSTHHTQKGSSIGVSWITPESVVF